MLLAPDRTKSRPDFRGIAAVAVDIDVSVHGVPPSAGPQSSGQTHAAPYRDPPPGRTFAYSTHQSTARTITRSVPRNASVALYDMKLATLPLQAVALVTSVTNWSRRALRMPQIVMEAVSARNTWPERRIRGSLAARSAGDQPPSGPTSTMGAVRGG